MTSVKLKHGKYSSMYKNGYIDYSVYYINDLRQGKSIVGYSAYRNFQLSYYYYLNNKAIVENCFPFILSMLNVKQFLREKIRKRKLHCIDDTKILILDLNKIIVSYL